MRTQFSRLTERLGFGSPPESVASSARSPARAVASGVISATGLVLLVPDLFPFLDSAAGIPDHERAVVTDDAEITQLTHGTAAAWGCGSPGPSWTLTAGRSPSRRSPPR